MAVSRLSKVVTICPRGDLGVYLGKLFKAGSFHPSEASGLVQDMQLVLLSSQVHAVYSDASRLLRQHRPQLAAAPKEFQATSVIELVQRLQARVAAIDSTLTEGGKPSQEVADELEAIRGAALSIFNGVSRLRVRPGGRRFLVVEGFVPTAGLAAFERDLASWFLSSEPVLRRQPGNPYIPTLVTNPRVVDLFQGITLSLGVPKYNEVDPTPIVAFVFPLFFGIMFSDLGRGLVLIVAGMLFRRGSKQDYRYLGNLLLVLGTSASIVGALRGLFFGVLLPYPVPLAAPGFLTEGASIGLIAFWLELSIVIGTVHLSGGYALAILNRYLSKDYSEAFLGFAPTLTFYASAVPLVLALTAVGPDLGAVLSSNAPTPFFSDLLGVNVPVSLVGEVCVPIAAASLLVIATGRSALEYRRTRSSRWAARTLVRGTAEAVVRPAELLIHTVSYIRLGILLVVGSVLGELMSVYFTLGPVGVALGTAGNLGVAAIEAFIVYVQDLRLNVYEWFSKFYSGLGHPFSPLRSSGPGFAVSWG